MQPARLYGIEALKELGSQIDLHDPATSAPSTRRVLTIPALQQLRCETTFNQGGLWNIPSGIDASQSGLQVLSAMCRMRLGWSTPT